MAPTVSAPVYVADKTARLGNVVEPQARDVILCTYPDTLDGWLAAWVVRGIAKEYALHVEFQINKNPLPDLTDRNWIDIGDDLDSSANYRSRFSITADASGGNMAVLSFARWERSIPFGVKSLAAIATPSVAVFGGHSLAGAAWQFFRGDRAGFEKRPRLIDYVEDTQEKLNGRRWIIACAESYFPMDFQTLDKIVEAADDRKRREMMFVAGQAIERYVAQQKPI